MSKRTYLAPLGATSITVNGRTYEVDGKGRLHCSDEAAHADLLTHGYRDADEAAEADAGAVVVTKPGLELAQWQRELDERALEQAAHGVSLAEREAALEERTKAAAVALASQADELNRRAAALADGETSLAMRLHAIEQREAALAAAPPPPPPADPVSTKKPGK